MTNMNQKYPNCLKQTIKESGYTIEGIAAEINIPVRTLHDYCAGRVPIPKYRLEVLAHALGYPIEYLVPKMTKEAVQQANIEREKVPEQPSSLQLKQGSEIQEILPLLSQAVSSGIVAAVRELGNREIDTSLTTSYMKSLRKTSPDIFTWKRNIRIALHLHRTSNAQGLLQDVNTDIRDLEALEHQTKGHDLYLMRELLISNGLLATKIVKDQRQYALASLYANNAVQVAENLEDGELIATTKYNRGCVKLEWAQFGSVKQRMLHIDREKIRNAICDFQEVLKAANSSYLSLHPQLQGFAILQLSRAQSLLTPDQHHIADANPLALADQAENMVDRDPIDDAYTRMIMTGTLSGLHQGGYLLTKADILIALGQPGRALVELNQFQDLVERTYGRDETRNHAWSDIVTARAFIGLKEYQEAISKAKNALLTCYTIHSMQNIIVIADLHSRLAASSYGKSEDVKELGDMLQQYSG